MEKQFSLETKTGEIVIDFPKSSSILKENKIGFCCSNNRPIGDISEDLGLDKHEVLNRINTLYETIQAQKQANTNDQWTVDEFIHHTMQIHENLKQELQEIDGYVSKIYRVHGGRHLELVTVHTLYQVLMDDLNHVIMKKEQTIFPIMRQANPSLDQEDQLSQAMNRLMVDYTNINKVLNSIRQSTSDFLLPEGVCQTFQLTYLKLEELSSDIQDMIQFEKDYLIEKYI